MPELPEAETVARGLADRIRGRVLGDVFLTRSDVVHGDPGPLCALVRGRQVEAVKRRGKRVILQLSGDTQLVFHLGMSGQVTVADRDAPVETHTHLRISISGGANELRYRDPRRFGGVWCLRGGAGHIGRGLSSLGVEPLEMTLTTFAQILRRDRQIKALLLDQATISGLGNIYCDEALYRARIHPKVSAKRLGDEQVRTLHQAIRRVLRSAIQAGGSSLRDYRNADGGFGAFQVRHQVYGRQGQKCKHCGHKIVRILVAGRSTHICRTCQRAPRRRKKTTR